MALGKVVKFSGLREALKLRIFVGVLGRKKGLVQGFSVYGGFL